MCKQSLETESSKNNKQRKIQKQAERYIFSWDNFLFVSHDTKLRGGIECQLDTFDIGNKSGYVLLCTRDLTGQRGFVSVF
jgi:hypothetical protein